MSPERRIEGLALKVGPLGEHDRLLTLLSDDVGLIRLAVPGARKPRSSLAAAVPLTTLELQVGGRSGLLRVRQLRVQHNFGNVGQRLERWQLPRPYLSSRSHWSQAMIPSPGCSVRS